MKETEDILKYGKMCKYCDDPKGLKQCCVKCDWRKRFAIDFTESRDGKTWYVRSDVTSKELVEFISAAIEHDQMV